MKEKLSTILLTTALVAVVGCFNEPVPAYKTVPASQRVYLSGRGLEDLKGELVASQLGADIDYLNLDRNRLVNVDEIARLSALKWLRLNDNQLAALPDLSQLKALRRIYLRGNKFTVVPDTLATLEALTDIDLSWNPIEEIPLWLAKKPGLQALSFSHTRITKLPEDLTAWRSLKQLQLGDLMLSAAEMARVRKALPDTAIVF